MPLRLNVNPMWIFMCLVFVLFFSGEGHSFRFPTVHNIKQNTLSTLKKVLNNHFVKVSPFPLLPLPLPSISENSPLLSTASTPAWFPSIRPTPASSSLPSSLSSGPSNSLQVLRAGTTRGQTIFTRAPIPVHSLQGDALSLFTPPTLGPLAPSSTRQPSHPSQTPAPLSAPLLHHLLGVGVDPRPTHHPNPHLTSPLTPAQADRRLDTRPGFRLLQLQPRGAPWPQVPGCSHGRWFPGGIPRAPAAAGSVAMTTRTRSGEGVWPAVGRYQSPGPWGGGERAAAAPGPEAAGDFWGLGAVCGAWGRTERAT